MVTRIELIDRARLELGCNPLGSETAPGAEASLAAYDMIVELVLGSHMWNCSTFTRELNRNLAGPETHWKYSFETPADMLGAPRAVYDRADCREPFKKFELFGENELRTDAERVWLKFTKIVAPTFWPGYLRNVIHLAMMSSLALSVREDRVLRDKLREDAYGTPSQHMHGGAIGQAKDLDDMANPSPILAEGENPLIDARW